MPMMNLQSKSVKGYRMFWDQEIIIDAEHPPQGLGYGAVLPWYLKIPHYR